MPLHPKNGGAQKQVSVSTTEFLIFWGGGEAHMHCFCTRLPRTLGMPLLQNAVL